MIEVGTSLAAGFSSGVNDVRPVVGISSVIVGAQAGNRLPIVIDAPTAQTGDAVAVEMLPSGGGPAVQTHVFLWDGGSEELVVDEGVASGDYICRASINGGPTTDSAIFLYTEPDITIDSLTVGAQSGTMLPVDIDAPLAVPGDSVTIEMIPSGSGPAADTFTFTWTDGSFALTVDATVPSGDYSLRASIDGGPATDSATFSYFADSVVDSVTVGAQSGATLSVDVAAPLAEAGDTINWQLIPNGGGAAVVVGTYTWSDGSSENITILNGTPTGEYILRVDVEGGPATDSASFTFTRPAVVVSSVSAGTQIGVAVPVTVGAPLAEPGDTVTWEMRPSGGGAVVESGSYTWTDGSTENLEIPGTVATGDYFFRVSIEGGATADSAAFAYTMPSQTAIDSITVGTLSGNAFPVEIIAPQAMLNDTVNWQLVPAGGGAAVDSGSFAWDVSGTTDVSISSAVQSGDYRLRVDINGASATDSAPFTLTNLVVLAQQSGLLTNDVAALDNTTNWSTDPDLAYGGGEVSVSGAANALHPLPAPLTSGHQYVAYIANRDRTGGTLRARLQDGTTNLETPSWGAEQNAIRNLVANSAYDQFGFRSNSTAVCRVTDAQLYDIQPRLDGPLDIYIFAGQSNMVGASGTTGFDLDQVRLESRALYVPLSQNVTQGAETDGSGPLINANLTDDEGIGKPILARNPLFMATQNTAGLSPGQTIIETLCNDYPQANSGRHPIFLGAAAGGTDLFDVWNPADDARYYDLMVANVNHYLGLNPGSRVAGLFWCQGESSVPAGYATLFNSIIDGLRASWGAFPVVIMEVGGVAGTAGVDNMIAEQQKLATGSGDADELARCAYVARPSGAALEADNIHFTGTTNLQRGIDAGTAMRTLLEPHYSGLIAGSVAWSYLTDVIEPSQGSTITLSEDLVFDTADANREVVALVYSGTLSQAALSAPTLGGVAMTEIGRVENAGNKSQIVIAYRGAAPNAQTYTYAFDSAGARIWHYYGAIYEMTGASTFTAVTDRNNTNSDLNLDTDVLNGDVLLGLVGRGDIATTENVSWIGLPERFEDSTFASGGRQETVSFAEQTIAADETPRTIRAVMTNASGIYDLGLVVRARA